MALLVLLEYIVALLLIWMVELEVLLATIVPLAAFRTLAKLVEFAVPLVEIVPFAVVF